MTLLDTVGIVFDMTDRLFLSDSFPGLGFLRCSTFRVLGNSKTRLRTCRLAVEAVVSEAAFGINPRYAEASCEYFEGAFYIRYGRKV